MTRLGPLFWWTYGYQLDAEIHREEVAALERLARVLRNFSGEEREKRE